MLHSPKPVSYTHLAVYKRQAHDLYYAMNEASFFAACEGMSGQGILKLEEDITKALIKDWKKYDVYGAVKC